MLSFGTGRSNFNSGGGRSLSFAPALSQSRANYASDAQMNRPFNAVTGVVDLASGRSNTPFSRTAGISRLEDAQIVDRSMQRLARDGVRRRSYDSRLAVPNVIGPYAYPEQTLYGPGLAYPVAEPYPPPATYYRGSLPPYYRERIGDTYVPPMPYVESPPYIPPKPYSNLCTISSYPPASPECMPYMSCVNSSNPNDCRSCVSALGGTEHCATQICGPHLYR